MSSTLPSNSSAQPEAPAHHQPQSQPQSQPKHEPKSESLPRPDTESSPNGRTLRTIRNDILQAMKNEDILNLMVYVEELSSAIHDHRIIPNLNDKHEIKFCLEVCDVLIAAKEFEIAGKLAHAYHALNPNKTTILNKINQINKNLSPPNPD